MPIRHLSIAHRASDNQVQVVDAEYHVMVCKKVNARPYVDRSPL